MKPYYEAVMVVTISGPDAKHVSECARKVRGRINSKTSELLRLKMVKQDNICFELRTQAIRTKGTT